MSSAASVFVAPFKFSRFRSVPSITPSSPPPCYRVVCRSGSPQPPPPSTDLRFALHNALESSGIDTSHARIARKSFVSQIQKLSVIERETSICINRCVDLGRTALYIAAEDASLVSHSSDPLPVDAFLESLDDLSMGYCSHYNTSCRSSRENFLESIEKYLYVKKGFCRSMAKYQAEPQALYLHSVLTHRSGSAVMLSLIHSEVLKMLRLWGLLDFDVEIFFPHDLPGLPRAYEKQKSKESDQPHIMTVQMLLGEILRNLKNAFWPFQHDCADSLFLRAANAANCAINLMALRKACERLILLTTDPKEMRDYSVLLYHCGLYEQALKYLRLYQDVKSSSPQNSLTDSVSNLEEDAVEKLMVRLDLIAMEEGWTRSSCVRNFLGNNSEPW